MLPVQYSFSFGNVTWPENFGGYISIQLYDSQHTPDIHRKQLIIAPAVTRFAWDISDCGTDGCFISVTSSLPNKWYEMSYSFELLTPQGSSCRACGARRDHK